MAPINEYLLLLAHPASRIPTIPMDDTAIRKKIPTLKSITCSPLAKGIQPNASTDAIITTKGARLNRNRSTWLMSMISLVNILIISATLCMVP